MDFLRSKHRYFERIFLMVLTGEGLLTQMAFVPWNFDTGTLLLRHMGWLLTQGPLTHRILTQGGFWRRSIFAWHMTHFLCMAFDADWNGCQLTQINFTWQLTQSYIHGNWCRIMSMAIDAECFFFKYFIYFSFFLATVKFWQIYI